MEGVTIAAATPTDRANDRGGGLYNAGAA